MFFIPCRLWRVRLITSYFLSLFWSSPFGTIGSESFVFTIVSLFCLEFILLVFCQVINLKTISQDKKLTSVVQKVALQMNCKLGGELWAAAMPKDLKVNKKKK